MERRRVSIAKETLKSKLMFYLATFKSGRAQSVIIIYRHCRCCLTMCPHSVKSAEKYQIQGGDGGGGGGGDIETNKHTHTQINKTHPNTNNHTNTMEFLPFL